MQIIKASRDAILKPLQTVAGIVEKRHTLPILANVLIRKDGETVSFTGTDIEMQVQTRAAIGSGSESAALTVSARKLMDILRALPESEVTVALNGTRLAISTGKSRFALQTLPAADFPTLAVSTEVTSEATLPQKQLKHLLQMVHFAMAQQDIRFYLNGLLLVMGQQGIRSVATDGHRLAFCAHADEAASAAAEVIMPRKTVTELLRLLGDSEEPVLVQVVGHQIRISFGEVEFVTKLVEGKFPDYQRVIPTGYSKAIAINREQFSAALSRASILTNEKFKGVRLSLAPSLLRIQSSNAEQEEATEELDVDYNDAPLDIGFNVSYLLDVLANLKVDVVKVEFGDSNSSALISLPGDETFKYVIMPMRI
ncbi:MAG: DNA polymerase III subunit beta [Lautropia sp.]|nr:DNA polymerase III subunit beta [Lautropia sp.]